MTVAVPVDAEALVSAWLRGNSAVAALVGSAVYTTLPADKVWPAVRLERIGGTPPYDELVVDEAVIRFNVWGGPKALAWQIANTIRAELTNLPGVHDQGRVLRVVPGPCRYLPDQSMEPARPRVTFDATVYTTTTTGQ